MKSSFAGLLAAALVAFTGCDKSTPGGPGADDPNKKPMYGQADDSFDLSVPSSLPLRSTALKQGETTKVLISIKRGKNFDQDVALKFEDMPKGVTIEPASPTIKHNETEANLTLTAADDAALGDVTVKVKGHPTKGGDAANEFKLTVAKKDTFTLSVPSSLPLLSTALKQGETTAVSIGVKRDKNFDQDVTLKFEDMPKGVTIEPASAVVKSGEADGKFTLTAAKDASVGDFTVKVTGHPTKGADASNEYKFTVVEKK
jgi:hypothetical protein